MVKELLKSQLKNKKTKFINMNVKGQTNLKKKIL